MIPTRREKRAAGAAASSRGLVTALLAALAGCAPAAEPSGLAIANVTVVDAVSGLRANRTVIVRGDTIVAVEDAGGAPDVAEVVDGTGRYLIPGLWDMHVHLTYDPALEGAMPRLFLRWGVTSVRDTGGLLERILPVVEAMRAQGALAPRVFFAGPLLDGPKAVYDGNGRPEIGVATPTAAMAQARVAELARAGVDFIKIYELVSPDVFAALAEAGRERGLPVASHVPLSIRAHAAAPQVQSMEHLRNVELDCAAGAEELLAARRTALAESGPEEPGAALRSRLHALQRLPAIADFDERACAAALEAMTSTIQVPTLRLNAFSLRPPFAREDWDAAVAEAPPGVAAPWRVAAEAWRTGSTAADTTFAAWSLRLTGEMHRRGIPIGAGTDTPINYALPGYALHSELEMLVRAGLPPLEALGAATVRPAQFFGLEREMGRIEPGMRADLVLLDSDPSADISATRAIRAVVARGRLLRPADLAGGGG